MLVQRYIMNTTPGSGYNSTNILRLNGSKKYHISLNLNMTMQCMYYNRNIEYVASIITSA